MSQRYKVIVTDLVTDSLKLEHEILGDIADVTALSCSHEDHLDGHVSDADCMMIYHTVSISKKTIAQLQKCRLIVRCGVGYDNVDGGYARERGIPLANVPDYGTEEVADSAIGHMLSLTRGINLQNVTLRSAQEKWTFQHGTPRYRLRGRVFGIIGLGRIGSAAAIRAKAIGMDVIFFDPYVSDGRDKALGIRRVETLEELLRQSFVVSVHCFLSEETKHLLNAKNLTLMPKGSFLVNTARGAVIDTTAIAELLKNGHLSGVGLDVLPLEPPAANDPLLAAWRNPDHPAHTRLILNAHTAFYCEEGLQEMRSKGAEACRRALLNRPLRNIVN